MAISTDYNAQVCYIVCGYQNITKVIEEMTEKVKRVKQQYNNPNFKTNCLLSKPFLYDGMALDEIS